MKLERGRISAQMLMFSVFCFMQGTMLRSGFIISVTRNDSWAMAFTALLGMLPIVAIYVALLRRFPGKSLIEIDDILFGPILGKTVSALYLFFFISLCALNTRDLGNFIVDYLMPETPIAVIMLFFLLPCAYAIRKGVESFVRLAAVFCLLGVGAVVVNSLLSLKDVRLDFIKPLFQLPFMKYIQGTVTVMAVPMGELLAFMMIAPTLGGDKKTGKPLLLGLAFSAVFLAAVMLRDIVSLGPLVSIVSLPSFESVRYINLANILTRMESIYAIVLVILFFFKVCILLYAFVLGLSQLLNLKSYHTITLIASALVLFYSLFVFDSVMENMNWGATAAPFFSLIFEFLLPAISLLIAFLRKLHKTREVKA